MSILTNTGLRVAYNLRPRMNTYISAARVHSNLHDLTMFRHASLSGAKMFHSYSMLQHGHVHKPKPGEELTVTYISPDGSQQKVEAAAGDNLMDIAQANGVEMEGACGGSCACSTCHVIVDPAYFDLLDEPTDEENDMLDLAFGLTETSRLACQMKMSKKIDGIRVALPAMTRNLQARDFK